MRGRRCLWGLAWCLSAPQASQRLQPAAQGLAPPAAHRRLTHCPHPPRPDGGQESKLLSSVSGKGGPFEQSADWHERDHKLVWSLRNLKGGKEHALRVSGVWRKGGKRCG